MKKTLILGATENTERYAYRAAQQLTEKGHEIYAIGRREGEIFNTSIHTDKVQWEDIDTVTLYLSSKNQQPYYEYILGLKPKRIIFNPGTENPELIELAKNNGIEVEIGCTLVMLSIGNY